MSFQTQGNFLLTTTLPNVPKHVTRVGTHDAVLYWTSDSAMALRYQSGATWATTLTGPTAIPVESQSLVGPPRNFGDTVTARDRWAFWPHISANTNLQITAVQLDGNAASFTTANYVYANAVGAGEAVASFGATDSGVAAFVRQPDESLVLRFFTYPFAQFGAGLTADVTTSTNPVVANYATPFDPSAAVRVGRDRIYTMSVDEGPEQVRLHYLDVTVTGDTVAFDTVANTTTGLPSATEVQWIGAIDGATPTVAAIVANGSALSLTTTTPLGASPVTTSLGVSGTTRGEGEVRKFLAYDADTAFVYASALSLVAKVALDTGAVTTTLSSFTSLDAVMTAVNGEEVVTGTSGGSAVLGTNATASEFGAVTDMGSVLFNVQRLGVAQSQAVGTNFFAETTASGGNQDIRRYALDAAPPRGISVAAAYTNFTTLNANDVASVEALPNSTLVGVYNPSSRIGIYDPVTGDNTAEVNVGSVFGNMGVNPNGSTVYMTVSGNLITWDVGDPSATVSHVGAGGSGGAEVFPNGTVVWGASPSYIRVTNIGLGTTRELTNITTLSFCYGIRALSSGNILVTTRDQELLHEISISGSGTIIYSFYTPSNLRATGLFRYATDKFLVMFFNSTSSIYSLDYSGGAGTEAWTEIPITLAGGGVKPNWAVGYGLCIGPDSKLYTASYFSEPTANSGGFAVADPVV